MRNVTPFLKQLAVKVVWLVPVVCLLITAHQAHGQEERAVQEIIGAVDRFGGVFYTLPDLKEGQVLYARVEGISGDLDPGIGLGDASLSRTTVRDEYFSRVQSAVLAGRDPLTVVPEIADEFFLAWNDDSGTGYYATISYPIPEDGDYKLMVIGTTTRQTYGEFRLLVGLDAPEVLSGSARATSDTIAISDEENAPPRFASSEVSGVLTDSRRSTFYTLPPMKAGDTLYAYVEATDGDLAPILSLRDFGNKPLANSNYAGQESSASMAYAFTEASSDLTLRLTACCEDGSRTTSGGYRLVTGLNTPEVLDGTAVSSEYGALLLPIEVEIGVKLQQITGVDQKAENYGAVVALQMLWSDPALAFSPESCRCAFKTFRGDSFSQFTTANDITWPEFTLFNQQGNRWVQNRVVLVWPDGSALYFERFSTTFQAPDFNFTLFPFDQQDFYMRVDSLFPEEFFVFEDYEAFTEVGDQLGEEEWYIVDQDVFISSEAASTQSLSSRYSFYFEARRHLNFYIFRIFVPVLIIILVSWTTFFLKDYGKRVDVASGNLLLFIAFNFTISNDLPRLGYLTFMDIILVSTFVVTSLVVIFNVYLKRLEVDGKENFANRIDKYMIWIYPLGYFVAFGLVWFLFN